MQQLLFINLLKEKTICGFNQIYDEYACTIHAFILKITEDELQTEKLVSETFLNIWNEAPVINLRHPEPLLFVLQKASSLVVEQYNDSIVIKQKMIQHLKNLRQIHPITVVASNPTKTSEIYVHQYTIKPSA